MSIYVDNTMFSNIIKLTMKQFYLVPTFVIRQHFGPTAITSKRKKLNDFKILTMFSRYLSFRCKNWGSQRKLTINFHQFVPGSCNCLVKKTLHCNPPPPKNPKTIIKYISVGMNDLSYAGYSYMYSLKRPLLYSEGSVMHFLHFSLRTCVA